MIAMTMLLALCICFLLLIPFYGLDIDSTYIKAKDGFILYPGKEISGNTQAIKIQVKSDIIIWVIALPQKMLSATSSHIYRYDALSRPIWDDYSITKVGDTRNYKSLSVLSFFLITVRQDGLSQLTVTKKQTRRSIDPAGRVGNKNGVSHESTVNLSKKEGIMINCNGEKQIVHLK